MKKILSLIFLVALFNCISNAQEKDNILVTIDGKEITKKEFLRIYKKNNQNIQSGEQTDIDEYIDMFINFKLKVIEAENIGLDTIPSVKEEIKKYQNQLAKPYLLDSQVFNALVEEAYQRSQKEVKASHILVKFPKRISYDDTLRAHKKALGIRRRIVKKDEPFREVARATSDDPSVKNNSGDVGYFTAFRMVYPFENAVYSMNVGEISDPVETRFGYHIIKKTDERKAKGKIKVAHIMLLAPKSMDEGKAKSKKQKINEIYHKLKGGADFEDMAREHSEDRGSAKNGGELPWFGIGRMVPAFEKAAFSLDKKGEISKPVRTSVGWHVIKLLDKREIGSFEEAKNTIERKVENDQRYQIAQDSLLADLKKEYNYQLDSNGFKKLTNTLLDNKNNLYLNRLNQLNQNQTSLFKFDKKSFTVADFVHYLNHLPKELKNKYEGKYLFDEALKRFIDNKIIDYEKERLEKKYPEYKYVIKEYHDGILLFEIMDRKIWSKASEDTTGLKEYYENHKENYMWPERFKGKIYLCDNKETLKKVKKMKKGGLFRKAKSDEEILAEFNTKERKKVKIKEDLFSKGDNQIIDYFAWDIGDKAKIQDKKPHFVTGNIISPKIKSLNEARGAVIADYQNHLEEKWIKELRNKYEIIINEELLNRLKENNN